MVIRKLLRIKYFILLLGIVIIGLLINAVFFSAPALPNYITATASIGDIEDTVMADGTIKASKQVSVGAQVSGQIKKLYVGLGQAVKKGDMIAEIDDLTQKNNVKQTEASLKSLQAQRAAKMVKLKNYQLTYKRQQRLIKEQAGVQAELDLAKAELDSMVAEIDALDADIVRAQIAVDTATLDLDYTRIKAPMDGIIVAIPVEEGQTVNSVQSAPTIVKIAKLETMTVEARISEADIVKVKKGMPVYFSILGQPTHFYRGLTLRDVQPAPDSINTDNSLSSVGAAATGSAVYYNGLFDVNNPLQQLRIAMTAQVYIVLSSVEHVLTIPTIAINFDQTNPSQGTVYVMNKQGTVSERQVKIGVNNSTQAEIISGLQVGNEVVIGGLDGVSQSNKTPRRARM